MGLTTGPEPASVLPVRVRSLTASPTIRGLSGLVRRPLSRPRSGASAGVVTQARPSTGCRAARATAAKRTVTPAARPAKPRIVRQVRAMVAPYAAHHDAMYSRLRRPLPPRALASNRPVTTEPLAGGQIPFAGDRVNVFDGLQPLHQPAQLGQAADLNGGRNHGGLVVIDLDLGAG